MGTFSERMTYLYKTIREMDSFAKLSKQPSIILFLSLGYRDKRAVVFSTNSASFDDAWESLNGQASQYRKMDSAPIDYLKIDWVDSQATITIPRFIEILTKIKKNHFRKGISFDPQFKHAFLEQEVNANEFIQYNEKTGRAFLNAQNIMTYIGDNRPGMSRLDLKDVDSITIFTVQSVFLDKEQCHFLKNNSFNNGRRDTSLTSEHLQEMIVSGMNYLTDSSKESGKFTYGFYPCFDKEIETYNMLRHGNALYAMLEAYELFKNENTAHAIKRGLHFLVEHGIFIDKRKDLAYVVDQVGHKSFEIKLGANASAISAIVKYTEIFDDKSYLNIAKMLARGILTLQQRDGNFTHVLHFPSLAVKEAFRISNYDSEATLALLRLYRIDPNEEWFVSAKKTLDFFIKNESWKKPDHWLSYCINEMIKYRPTSQYVKFGLQLVRSRLDFIDRQEVIFPTFLEMTLSCYELVQRQKDTGSKRLFREFPEEKLEVVIHRRAEFQRNGYFYPELAIYFKNPKSIIGGFFSRYHSFRTRIDDVAHYLSGYCQYYKLFFSEDKPRSEEPIEEQDKQKEAVEPGQLKIGISLGKMASFPRGQAIITEHSEIKETDVGEVEKPQGLSEQQSKKIKILTDLEEVTGSEPEREVVTDEHPEVADDVVPDAVSKDVPHREPQYELKEDAVEAEGQEEFAKVDVEEKTQSTSEVGTPELTNELTALKKQLDELERKQEATREIAITTTQVQGLSQRLSDLTNELIILRKQSEGLGESAATTAQVEELSQRLSELTNELTTIRMQSDKLEEKQATSAAEAGATTTLVEELSQRLSELTNELTNLRKQLKQLKEKQEVSAEAFATTTEVEELTRRLMELTNELIILRKQSEGLGESAATTAQVEELSQRLSELTNELTTIRMQSDKLEEKQATSAAEAGATTTLVEELSQRLSNLTNELTTIRNQLKQLKEKQEVSAEAFATTTEVEELTRRLMELTNELIILRKQTEGLEETAATTKQVEKFTRRFSEITGELANLRKQSEELREKHEAAVESSATITQVEELSHQLADLESELTIIRNEAEDNKKQASTEANAITIQVHGLSQQLAELTSELTTLRNQSEQSKKQASTEANAITIQVHGLSQQLAELTSELTTLRNQSEESKKQASREVAATNKQVLALTRQLAELTNKLTTFRKQVKALEERQEISAETSATTIRVEALAHQLENLTNELTSLRKKSEGLEQALLKIEKDSEDRIVERILREVRFKGPYETSELKDLVREILEQLKAEGFFAVVAAEQAHFKKQPEQTSVDHEEIDKEPKETEGEAGKPAFEQEKIEEKAVMEDLEQPVSDHFPKDDELPDPRLKELPEKEKELGLEGQEEATKKQKEEKREETETAQELEEHREEVPLEREPEEPAITYEEPHKPKGLRRIFTAITWIPKRKERRDKLREKSEELKPIKAEEPKRVDAEIVPIPEEGTSEQELEPEKFKPPSEVEETHPKAPEEKPEEQGLQTGEKREEPTQEVPVESTDEELTQEVPAESAEEEPQEALTEFAEESQESQEKPEGAKKQDPIWPKVIKPEDKVPQTGNLGEIEKLIEELEQSKKMPKPPEKHETEGEHPEVAEGQVQEKRKVSQQILENLDEKEFEQEWDSIPGHLFEKYREEAGAREKQPIETGEQQIELETPPVTELSKRKRGKFVNALGNILIIIGLVVTAIFAYQVISTKIAEHKALQEAENNLNGNPMGEHTDEDDPEAEARKKAEMIENYQAEFGEAFATVEIPKLQKTLPIIEGTDPDVLDKGVGHLKQSVFPGQNEQIVISGHRDTVFRGFEKLEIGDKFIIRMPYGTYTYEMKETEIVDEDDTTVVRSMGEEVLVVTTCYPFYYIGNAPQRFVIYAYPVDNE